MKKQDGSSFWCRLLGQAVDPARPGQGGTIWIAEDVTEWRRLDAALAAARDAAEAASRTKSAFLANTITNAVKFTSEGSVRIVAEPGRTGGVRLAVVDTGAGVDAQLQRLLFQPFSQGDSSTTRRFGGTGLGLSICRQLAQLMGGQVGVESKPSEGSIFWAELPLAPAILPGESLASETSECEQLHDGRILLVEDNPVNMMIAAATLAQWGIDVAEARDGRMAVEAVQEAARRGRPFDLVLMDVQMPVMSDHEAAIELRKAWGPGALPIIALTAAALVSERDLALAAGMNDFLTKPIDAPKLRRTLARHVRRAPATETETVESV